MVLQRLNIFHVLAGAQRLQLADDLRQPLMHRADKQPKPARRRFGQLLQECTVRQRVTQKIGLQFFKGSIDRIRILAILKQGIHPGLVLVYILVVVLCNFTIPGDQFWPASLDVVPQFVPGNGDESDIVVDVDVDRPWLAGDVDAVEEVEPLVRWRNWSYVSPEGSLKRLPDSRKGVRQFNRFICISPIVVLEIAGKGIIQRLDRRLVCRTHKFERLRTAGTCALALVGFEHVCQFVAKRLHVAQIGIASLVAPAICQGVQEIQECPCHTTEHPLVALGQSLQENRIGQRIRHGSGSQLLLDHILVFPARLAIPAKFLLVLWQKALALHLIGQLPVQVRVRAAQVMYPLVGCRQRGRVLTVLIDVNGTVAEVDTVEV